MPNYRRARITGATFFFTVVTHGRRRWLCADGARTALRESIVDVRTRYPFAIDAWVLLPDHLHCIWTLPDGDGDFSLRWRLIKSGVTRRVGGDGALASPTRPTLAAIGGPMTASRKRRRERKLWQRRFWEHTIRDETDFAAHCDYVHYNPVKHGLVAAPKDWPHSTFHRYVRNGLYDENWGAGEGVEVLAALGRE